MSYSAAIVNDKKALDAVVLDVSGFSSISDYVMICSGSSDRQVRAIADSLLKNLEKCGIRPLNIEGYAEGQWVLLDYNDLIIHIFYDPVRSYYRLEELWAEAKKMELPDKKKA